MMDITTFEINPADKRKRVKLWLTCDREGCDLLIEYLHEVSAFLRRIDDIDAAHAPIQPVKNEPAE